MQREGLISAGPETEPMRAVDARRPDAGLRGGPPRTLDEVRFMLTGGLTLQEAEQRDAARRQRIRSGRASFGDAMAEFGALMVPGLAATRGYAAAQRFARAAYRAAPKILPYVERGYITGKALERLNKSRSMLAAIEDSAEKWDAIGAAARGAVRFIPRNPYARTGMLAAGAAVVGGTAYYTHALDEKLRADLKLDEIRRQTRLSNAEKALASLYAVADDDTRMAALYGEDGRGMPQRLIAHLRSLSDTMRGLRAMSADASGDRTRSDAEAYREAVGRLTASSAYGPAFKSVLDDVVKSVAPELHPDNIEAAFGNHQRAMEAEYRQRLEAQKQEGR